MNAYPTASCCNFAGTYLLRLVLMRHGKPADEAQGICYGRLDVGLSDSGRAQIRSRISLLRFLAPDVIYTSTSTRATESATEVEGLLNLQAQAVPELCEIDFGAFEGLTYAELERRFPREFRRWMESPTDTNFPGGEGFFDLKRRAIAFQRSLLVKHERKTVLIISHAGINRVLLADALGLPDGHIFRIDQTYAGVSVIDYLPDSVFVRLMNG